MTDVPETLLERVDERGGAVRDRGDPRTDAAVYPLRRGGDGMIQFTPLKRGLLCRELPQPKQESPIHVVQQYGPPCLCAEVLVTGPETRDIKVGDRIVVPAIAGMNLDVGEPLLLVQENVVLATLEREA